ncbi:hypothetical protein AURDEDRAFT_116082 [Auricularia subglabra TFB-10046 SS5]|uniref:RRM domain-containing protein n=1 Tax=Auricularia subglabra (strain TFB-10046 / SS5) TaxID=717982 RepID=J0WX93_AURST|nr:hypothetical protein AURDEDRAFT_116082 [Auricularia subglabra TFB-10046 SS5]
MADSSRRGKPYDRPERTRAPEGQWLHDRAPRGSAKGRDSTGGRQRRSSDGGDDEAMPKLVVSNLHYEVTDRDLSSAFGAYGSFSREPFIRYDRSGRSTGVGVVIYTTADEAARAKAQMQGVILKGEPIDIKYEKFLPRTEKPGGRPLSSDPSSLLNRIGKPPLKDRITDGDAPMQTDKDSSGPGPVRTKSARGRGAGRGGARGESGRKSGGGPKTAEQLDKELENYAAKPAAGGDVEMAT